MSTGLAECQVSAPGGICNGCGKDSDCERGDSHTYTCTVGAGSCNQDCNASDPCPSGLRCVGGVCRLTPCSSGSPCASPYVCDGGFCRRATCTVGDGTCADGSCIGGYCVNDLEP